MAAVKISSVRRKAARKFWAPQQDQPALRMTRKNVQARFGASRTPPPTDAFLDGYCNRADVGIGPYEIAFIGRTPLSARGDLPCHIYYNVLLFRKFQAKHPAVLSQQHHISGHHRAVALQQVHLGISALAGVVGHPVGVAAHHLAPAVRKG